MLAFLLPLIDALAAQTPSQAQVGWKNGPSPMALRATAHVPVQQYIDWIVALEQALPGRTPSDIIRRVRRIHYSNFSLKPESQTSQSMDELMADTSDNPDGDPPATTADVAQAVLDGLYSTSAVVTGMGHTVDITHTLCVLDFAVNGRSIYAGAATVGSIFLPNYAIADADLMRASIGWLGDLGSIWNEWMFKRADRTRPTTLTGAERTLFEQQFPDRCPLDDLLGDLDGAVLATSPDLATQALSTTLSSYYKDEATAAALTAPVMNSRQRFHYFVDRSIPAFAHQTLSSTPLRTRVAASNAATIVTLIRNLASITWSQYHRIAVADPATHDPIFLELSNRLLKWLQDGLADPNCGVPPWPTAPTARPT